MKVTKKVSSFLLAVILCFATLVGFANNTATTAVYASGNSDVVKIGISMPSSNDHETNILNPLDALCQAYGFQVSSADAQNSASNQVDQINQFIDNQVDIIVVMPVDENALVGVLTDAANAGIGIIVIGYNNGLYPNALYINFDYAGIGESNADDFLNNHYDAGAGAKVLIVACANEHGDDYSNAVENKFQNTSVVCEEIRIENVEYAADAIKNWIAANNGLLPAAIFCCCYTNAQIVKQVLLELGFTFGPGGIPIYGLGVNGNIYDALVEKIFELIQKLLSGEINPTGDITEGTILVGMDGNGED